MTEQPRLLTVFSEGGIVLPVIDFMVDTQCLRSYLFEEYFIMSTVDTSYVDNNAYAVLLVIFPFLRRIPGFDREGVIPYPLAMQPSLDCPCWAMTMPKAKASTSA